MLTRVVLTMRRSAGPFFAAADGLPSGASMGIFAGDCATAGVTGAGTDGATALAGTTPVGAPGFSVNCAGSSGGGIAGPCGAEGSTAGGLAAVWLSGSAVGAGVGLAAASNS